jgi:hypothetical protein
MLQAFIDLIEAQFAQLPDNRKASPNRKYSVRDAALSAFAVFMLQAPSFLAQQRDMQRTKGRNNAQSLFGVHQIPSDNQIRNILDPIAPSQLSGLFWQAYARLQAAQLLTAHTGIAGSYLCALDGLYYFSSRKVHCPNCTRQQHEGYVSYSHGVIAPVLVAPDSPQVFSLEPEFMQPQDGSEKQDCELNASKRWLSRNGARLPAGRTTFLADDLYCKQPLCELVLDLHHHFILVCLPESHLTLYAEIELLAAAGLLDSLSERVWNGRFYEQRTYRFTNRVPLRAGVDALMVNWSEVSIVHEQTGELLYHNSFATDFVLNSANVAAVVRSGRARWKTENENHNTLKNRGYHLEHNFGHGKQYLSALLVAFNLLAFLLHTVMFLTEPTAQQIRSALGTLQTFWGDLQTLTRYFYFKTWAALFHFMAAGLELEHSP